MCEVGDDMGTQVCLCTQQSLGKGKLNWKLKALFIFDTAALQCHQSTVLPNYGRIVFEEIRSMDRVIKMQELEKKMPSEKESELLKS